MTELTFPRAHPNSMDPVEIDLFSGSRFTKHCKSVLPGVRRPSASATEAGAQASGLPVRQAATLARQAQASRRDRAGVGKRMDAGAKTTRGAIVPLTLFGDIGLMRRGALDGSQTRSTPA